MGKLGKTLLRFVCLLSPAAHAQVLLWSDEFNGRSIDSHVWSHMTGHNTNGMEMNTDDPKNSFIEDGQLVIQSLIEPGENNFTSARFTTENFVHVKYGRVEARLKIPKNNLGGNPAFWMLGTNKPEVGWKTCGEIDIMEAPGFDQPATHATLHSQCHDQGKTTTVPTMNDEFHVYGFDWSPDFLKFHVDGEVFHTYAKSEQSCWPFDQYFYFQLTSQVSSDWGRKFGIDLDHFPWQFRLDWVRVYSLPSVDSQVWVRRASGDKGESGCGDGAVWSGQGYESMYICTAHCESKYESPFVEFHPDGGWCGCFSSCDFSRPVSAYGTRADVYERLPRSTSRSDASGAVI